MIWLIPSLAYFAEIIWQFIVSYPPTTEQLKIGIINTNWLVFSRLISLVVIIISGYKLSVLLPRQARKYFWIFFSILPVVSLLCLSNPFDVAKIFIMTLVFTSLYKTIKNTKLFIFLILIMTIIVNVFIFKEHPKLLTTLSITKSQEEVTFRFMIEDNIQNPIAIPLFVKRISYNKYFETFKKSFNELLTFFDLETLFFGEIHPLGQKAFVVFFWPEVYIFMLSIYQIWKDNKIKKKNKPFLKVLIALTVLSFTYFSTSTGTAERRQIFTAFLIVTVMSYGSYITFKSKNNLLKSILAFLIAVTLYGSVTNIYDRTTRQELWLDNKPLAYEYIFKTIKTNNIYKKYKNIAYPDTLYSLKEYCQFYLQDCDNFYVQNFNHFLSPPENDTLYIGFTGNFEGKNSINTPLKKVQISLESKDMFFYGGRHVLDNIASGWGQDLIIAGGLKSND